MEDRLPLHEEVMLLALKDDKGSVDAKAQFYPQIVAGAILSELLLSNIIEVSPDKKQRVEVVRDIPLDNNVLNEALDKILSKKRPQPLKYWLNHLSGIPKLKNKIGQSLCEKGILDEVEVRILWVFSVTRFPEANPKVEKALIERLKDAIFSDSSKVDVRTATLISLLKKTNVLDIPFSSKQLKQRKDRIESIAKGELISDATAEVIQTIQAMVVITSVMPAIMVATG